MVTRRTIDPALEVDIDRLTAIVASDVGEPAETVRAVVERVVHLVLEPDDADAAAVVAADGEQAARDGLLPEQLLDRYLSTLWALWEMRVAGIRDPEALAALGDRLLRTADDLVAAVAVGYRSVERELIVNNADARRAFLDELFGTLSVDSASIGRLRRMSGRNGLEASGSFRLIAMAGPIMDDDAVAEDLAAQVRKLLTGPSSVDRARAGVALPQVVAWRGRVVVLARVRWPGLDQLRTGLEASDGEWTAVQSGSVAGVESLAPGARPPRGHAADRAPPRPPWLDRAPRRPRGRAAPARRRHPAGDRRRARAGPDPRGRPDGRRAHRDPARLLRCRGEHPRDGPEAASRRPDRRLPADPDPTLLAIPSTARRDSGWSSRCSPDRILDGASD